MSKLLVNDRVSGEEGEFAATARTELWMEVELMVWFAVGMMPPVTLYGLVELSGIVVELREPVELEEEVELMILSLVTAQCIG